MIKTKLFTKYINIQFGDHLQNNIIDHFHGLICLPNICEGIDNTHIP
jgi:hypothetical protein